MTADSNGTSAFEEYRRLINELPKGIAGSVELVATQLSETAERLLRLTSIPHNVDKEVIEILLPDLDREALKAASEELRPLSFVIDTGEGWVLHDEVRAYLFEQWLQAHAGNIEKWKIFESVSARLAKYYAGLAENGVGEVRAVAERQRIFHLVGADRNAGFDAFQRRCRSERYQFRLESCETLIKLMREYEPIFQTEVLNWLDYHEAKLLLDLKRHGDAKEGFERLLEKESARDDPALLFRCLYRLAAAVRETRDFQQAREIYVNLRNLASVAEVQDQVLRAAQGLGSLLIEMGLAEEAE